MRTSIHTTGLLILHEGGPLSIDCTDPVFEVLTTGNPILNVLDHFCGVRRTRIPLDPGSHFRVEGAPSLRLRALAHYLELSLSWTQLGYGALYSMSIERLPVRRPLWYRSQPRPSAIFPITKNVATVQGRGSPFALSLLAMRATLRG